jgi:hypothetical protein
MVSYPLTGDIRTDAKGTQILLDFYLYAKKHKDCWFNINIENLYWFDGNLSATLLRYCHLLKTENKLKFYIDYKSLKGHLNVLSRNGLAYNIVNDKQFFKPYDDRDTTIAVKAFKLDSVDSFANYIENSLLKHQGLGGVIFDDKDRIKTSYFEIFDNVGQHGKTSYPILACGQFYPNEKELKFTFVDSGCGFLENVIEFTKGSLDIKKSSDAISWAAKGNSTKKIGTEKGGTGLSKILSYCLKSGGALHIVSDDCYWAFANKSINTFNIKNNICGATIHLIFRYLNQD